MKDYFYQKAILVSFFKFFLINIFSPHPPLSRILRWSTYYKQFVCFNWPRSSESAAVVHAG